MVPQREQRATWREPIMRGLRAPSDEMRRAPAGAPGSRSGLRAAAVGPRPRRLRPIAVVVLVAALAVFAVVAHSFPSVKAVAIREVWLRFINCLSADDGAHDLDVLDLVRIHVVRILLEHHEVGELARP